jgi:hypothetical protein
MFGETPNCGFHRSCGGLLVAPSRPSQERTPPKLDTMNLTREQFDAVATGKIAVTK